MITKSGVKPESEPSLKEVAKRLQGNPKTQSVGVVSNNSISQHRIVISWHPRGPSTRCSTENCLRRIFGRVTLLYCNRPASRVSVFRLWYALIAKGFKPGGILPPTRLILFTACDRKLDIRVFLDASALQKCTDEEVGGSHCKHSSRVPGRLLLVI